MNVINELIKHKFKSSYLNIKFRSSNQPYYTQSLLTSKSSLVVRMSRCRSRPRPSMACPRDITKLRATVNHSLNLQSFRDRTFCTAKPNQDMRSPSHVGLRYLSASITKPLPNPFEPSTDQPGTARKLGRRRLRHRAARCVPKAIVLLAHLLLVTPLSRQTLFRCREERVWGSPPFVTVVEC